MANINSAVNKILEGAPVRKMLESAGQSMKIQDFVDSYFDNNVDFYTWANEFVWYDALLACSKKVKDDFDKTFDTDEWDWDEWFGKRWGFYADVNSEGFCTAPDCDQAGVDGETLAEFVRKNNDLHYVTQYGGEIYLVAKPM